MNREALIHSIMMSEVKGMVSQVLQVVGKTLNKKTLKFYLLSNFYNFQERKNGKALG